MTEAAAGASVPAPAPAGRRRGLLVAAVAAVIILLDQVSKTWAENTLADHDIDLFWTLRWHLERNSGAAFSLNRGRGGIVALLALGVVAVIIVVGRQLRTKPGAVAVGLVLGGALGNLIDRAVRDGSGGFLGGSVIDFIDLQWWPVFNVADIGVTVGGVLLVLVAMREPA